MNREPTNISHRGSPITEDTEGRLPNRLRPLTYKQAAELLGVCQKTVENICRVRKEIPITWIGQKPRILYGNVLDYIERGGSTVKAA
jgi:hypothetical protein